MKRSDPYVIGIPVYDGVDLLDVSVPYELFNWMAQIEPTVITGAPRREVKLVSVYGTTVETRDGMHLGKDLPKLEDSGAFDLLWVPGGDPVQLQKLMLDPRLMTFLQRQAKSAEYVTSVCEGALLLASAGLLDGYQATTHWAFIACLKLFPDIAVAHGYPRYVVDRNRVTGGGISSGMDEALAIIALLSNDIVAREVQLSVQYKPCPPFNDGDPSVATPPVYTPGSDSTCSIPGMAETISKVLNNSRARVG
jgi:transcriptional regulator GlxA family with amidase domain